MSCVIVLGFYRSGTSAVAGLLHHLGVFMGEKFDLPNDNNKYGYWEDLEFKALHKQMLEELEVQTDVSVVTFDHYRALVEERQRRPLWGVKDPRLCVLMPKLDALLGRDYRIIVCWRPKEEIFDSLKKAKVDDHDSANFLPLLEAYESRMDDFLHTCERDSIGVSFNDLKLHTQEEVERIANFVNLPVNPQALEFVRQ